MSYISLLIGILLIITEFVFKYNDILGYIITTLGILLTILGILSNKILREFFINMILNYF